MCDNTDPANHDIPVELDALVQVLQHSKCVYMIFKDLASDIFASTVAVIFASEQ